MHHYTYVRRRFRLYPRIVWMANTCVALLAMLWVSTLTLKNSLAAAR